MPGFEDPEATGSWTLEFVEAAFGRDAFENGVAGLAESFGILTCSSAVGLPKALGVSLDFQLAAGSYKVRVSGSNQKDPARRILHTDGSEPWGNYAQYSALRDYSDGPKQTQSLAARTVRQQLESKSEANHSSLLPNTEHRSPSP